MMALIRCMLLENNEYGYLVDAYWDSKLKKSREKTTYLGIVVDKQKVYTDFPGKIK